MESCSFDRPLVVAPAKSRLLSILIFLSHSLTILFVFTLLTLPLWMTLITTLMIMLSLAYYYQWHIAKCLNKSIVEALFKTHDNKQSVWLISLPTQKDLPVELQPSSFSSRWLILLNFKDRENLRYSLIVPADAVPDEIHRQLRVRLKILF